jgi:hypothetical protein
MKLIEIDTKDRRQVKQFLQLPFRLYANTSQWVPPLAPDAQRMLDKRRNPFFIHSQAAFFLVVNEQNRALGRLAVLNNRRYNEYNHEKTAFFYLFECENSTDVALMLFEAAFQWARDQGLNLITGPKGFTVFDGLGLLVKGYEHRPAFGLPYNPPYYPDLVETAGFEPDGGDIVSGYLNSKMQFPETIHQVARRLQERRDLRVARFNSRRDLRLLVPRLKDLYNGVLAHMEGNIPLIDEEVKLLADQMLWFANPRLIKIVYKGDQPVGFLLAYPDISAAVQRTKGRIFPFGWIVLLLELRRTKWININGAGMLEGYRGLGGTALLFSEMHRCVVEEGYVHADLVQIGIDNERMQRELRDLGIDFYKTHRLYSRML